MDFRKITEFGKSRCSGVLRGLHECGQLGHTQSEAVLQDALMRAFNGVRGRIILATFASSVSRVQMAVDAAVAHERKLAVFGRSMVNVVGIAREMGYLKAPEGTFIDAEEVSRYRPDPVADSDDEVRGNHWPGCRAWRTAHIGKSGFIRNDTVILSASPIPGVKQCQPNA